MAYENGCGPFWCSEPNNIWGCAFPPNMTYRMIEMYAEQRHQGSRMYNEVVVDAEHMAIEAVLSGRGAGRGGSAAIHKR